MSLYEIDQAATQARIDTVTTGGLRALNECARRAEEIDKQVEEMFARQEREKKAIDEQVEQGNKNKPEPPDRPTAKPGTLALGAEEFREAREAEQAARPGPQPAPRAEASPGPTDAARDADEPQAPAARRTLRLGAPDDREETEQARPAEQRTPPKPAPRRSPAEGDDDMSGRTWLR